MAKCVPENVEVVCPHEIFLQALIAGGLDNVRWDLLSDAAKGPKVWAALARKMGPQALRMNLNTLLRHDVFSVEQLSSTVSEAGTNFTSDKRLGKSFYNRVGYVADRIADESEIRRGNSSRTRTWLEPFSP